MAARSGGDGGRPLTSNASIAWVLNLDADLELARGTGYTPRRSLEKAMRPYVERLATSLLGAGDILIDATSFELHLDGRSHVSRARGLRGRAFCPTPRALRALRTAGADPEPHPTFAVLRGVNSRAFAASLGPTLPGARFVTDREAARSLLDRDPVVGRSWRVKRAFGMAGRGQRVVAPSSVTAMDLVFVDAAIAEGGVAIEPNVAIEVEVAIHGLVAIDGSFRLGNVVRQRCDARGAWLATELLGPGEADDVIEPLREEASRVARALSAAEYFGPFGVDAYTFHDVRGRRCFQPRSEINARYSMGFAIGFCGA